MTDELTKDQRKDRRWTRGAWNTVIILLVLIAYSGCSINSKLELLTSREYQLSIQR